MECTPRGNNIPAGVATQCAPGGADPRFYSGETLEGFSKHYLYNPDATRKTTIDGMVDGMYAVPGFTAIGTADANSIASTLSNAVLSSLGGQVGNLFTLASVNKYFGFFFGFGNSSG